MEYYNKVIESVGVRFLKGNNYKIDKSVSVADYNDTENTVILLHQGSLKFAEDGEGVNEGEILFIPAGRKSNVTFGSVNKKSDLTNEAFLDNKRKYLQTISFKEIKSLEARIDKPLGAFVPELRQMEYARETIETDLNRLQLVKDDVQAFYLASAVTSSIDPVKPKKLLILLGATFFSLLLGMVIVLVTEGVRSYHARSHTQ